MFKTTIEFTKIFGLPLSMGISLVDSFRMASVTLILVGIYIKE